MIEEYDYQGWIQWVEVQEFEWVSGSFPNTVHFIQIPGIGGLFNIVDTFGDEKKWTKICVKIQFNLKLIKLQNKELLDVLKEYQNIFIWHKGELGISSLGEHTIYTQGFPLCSMTPSKLSFWEKT